MFSKIPRAEVQKAFSLRSGQRTWSFLANRPGQQFRSRRKTFNKRNKLYVKVRLACSGVWSTAANERCSEPRGGGAALARRWTYLKKQISSRPAL